MKKSDFYFDLPEELIAQTPLERRDASRLLHLDKATGALEHRHFYDLPEYLRAGDCLVLNDSRVLPARLIGSRPSGGAVELVLLRDLGDGRWECLSRPGRKTRPGQELLFGDGELRATVEAVAEGGNRIVQFHYEGIFLEVLERLGKMPLPPYIKAELADSERYQTVYSREPGSAAAPTAGLHFTEALLEQIRAKGVKVCFVTLHVGLEDRADHQRDEGRGRPCRRRRHHLLPHARELCQAGRDARAELRLDGHFHLPRLPLQVHRRAGDQFPSPGEHAHHAGLRSRRA